MEQKHSDNTDQNVHRIDRLTTLKKESTVALVRRIVEDSDNLALDVFLGTRRIFHTGSEKPLLLHEFLSVLHEMMARNDFRYKIPNVTTTEVADCVYDKTQNKYTNLPQQNKSHEYTNAKSSKKKEVDCRKYYHFFLKKMQEKMDEGEIKTQEDEEVHAGILLQKLVAGNFFSRSFKDCRRELSHSIRYKWKVGGGKLFLLRPRHVEVGEFREWLKTLITDVDLKKPKEKQRIQSLVDKHFASIFIVPLVEDKEGEFPDFDKTDSLETRQKQMFTGSLAETVAGDKVANIHKLRRAIRTMGKEALEHMILKIFTDLAEHENYELSQLAREYKISKATLSRFAGTKWKKDRDSGIKYIPDLWQNTAETLENYPVLMETASASGFADRIKEVLEFIKP